VTASGYDGRARLASGSAPTSAVSPYRVSVAGGSVRLSPESTGGVVLDVPVDRVRAHPWGRAGSVVLMVDSNPVLLNFSDHEPTTVGAGVTSRARRLADAALGRRQRDRFLRALDGAGGQGGRAP
jgi:hypothetical protein